MGRHFQYLLDAVAGIALGAAVCFSATSVFQVPFVVGASLGALVFVRVFASLIRLPLLGASQAFVPAPLDFEEEAELLLDSPLPAPSASPRVVPLFSQARTPGEMHEAIERHLRTGSNARDATEELRQALDQLRRSVG